MKCQTVFTAAILVFELSRMNAYATEFEPFGAAVKSALGFAQKPTPEQKKQQVAFQKSFAFEGKPLDVFYSKDKTGKASKYAFVQKGIYEPNCTHTWVVAIDPASEKVTDIRTVELACPHAFPTRSESFTGQFKGKKFADAQKLKSEVTPIAKATGSSELLIEAVRKSLTAASKLKGKI